MISVISVLLSDSSLTLFIISQMDNFFHPYLLSWY